MKDSWVLVIKSFSYICACCYFIERWVILLVFKHNTARNCLKILASGFCTVCLLIHCFVVICQNYFLSKTVLFICQSTYPGLSCPPGRIMLLLIKKKMADQDLIIAITLYCPLELLVMMT